MAQKITQKQLQEIVGAEVIDAITNKEIELLKKCEFDPRVYTNKLKTTTCVIELVTNVDNKEEIIIGCSCKRKWISIQGFSEHIINKECKYYK